MNSSPDFGFGLCYSNFSVFNICELHLFTHFFLLFIKHCLVMFYGFMAFEYFGLLLIPSNFTYKVSDPQEYNIHNFNVLSTPCTST